MKYLKYFEQASAYEAYKNGSDFITPNVSYAKDNNVVYYDPKTAFMLRAKYNATPDNLVAFTGAENLKSLKVNGASIEFEPVKNENFAFDVLGENISLDMSTGDATFPESYVIKSPVSSWSFKAKDPNYVLNENTYVCMLGMYDDGWAYAEPMPIAEAVGYVITTNDGVTLEVTDTFLAEMNMGIQDGVQVGVTLMDADMNSGTFMFIDTEHQTNIITGGLSTYSFDSEGFYDVEIELSDPDMNGIQFAETSLISIEIGDGITSIGEYTFDDCKDLTSVTIGSSVTEIDDYAFSGCSRLTSIIIPDSVISIGAQAFADCSGLTGELIIPESVKSIGEKAFYNCSGLTGELIIPDHVTSIGDYTFKNCSGLTGELIIPESVTSIGTSAFENCSGLTSVHIGSGVTYIGRVAFNNCKGLTGELIIPDGVITIDQYAFYNCKKLKSVIIPNSVTTIGNYVFGSCSILQSITCLAPTAPSINMQTFGEVPDRGILKVPSGSDYSSWMRSTQYYLGYYNWTIQYI